MANDTPTIRRYQAVYPSSGIDVATTPPADTRTVTMWPAAGGGWVRYRDHAALVADLLASYVSLAEDANCVDADLVARAREAVR